MLVDEYELLPSDGRNHFRPEELGNSIVIIKIYITLRSQLRLASTVSVLVSLFRFWWPITRLHGIVQKSSGFRLDFMLFFKKK